MKRAVDASGLPITREAPSNQNATNKFLREKPEAWPPCLSHKFKRGNRAKDWWIPNKPFKRSHGAGSLITRDSSCNQMKASVRARIIVHFTSHTAPHGDQIESL